MADTQALPQEIIAKFVGAAHGDFATVQTMLTEEPALLNARFEEWNECALEAASHMGQREIAEFLLAQGAPLTICAASMLGRSEDVTRFLTEEPALANSAGAHGIPVLFHAAMSGNTRIANALLKHGGGQGMSAALHGATRFGYTEMVRWLLAHGAEPNPQDYQGKTPLAVALELGHETLAALLREHEGVESV
ncbi:MAG: ankyrin repeat domain-containing protein [Ardenticatenales bacterium]|nr:ankyrin repeat domain-containing protein [Ardenticatenales bacterium]